MLFDPQRLNRVMEAAGVEVLVASCAENVRYLTGIESVALAMFPHSPQCFAVLRRGDPDGICFVSSFCEIDQVLDADPGVRDTVGYGEFYRDPGPGVALSDQERRLAAVVQESPRADSPLEALVLALKRGGAVDGTVAVDESGLPPEFLLALAERLGPAKVVPAASLFRHVRRLKTGEEVERLGRAAACAEAGIEAVTAILAEGVAEHELRREFERAVLGAGAKPAFTLIRIGRNGIAGQAEPDSTELRRGDSVWFDVGCTYRGYWADLARVVVLGEPSDRLSRVYEAARQGQEAGIGCARAGTGVADLFQHVVETVTAAGIPDYRRHHVGHGIGLEVYDAPMLSPSSEDVLEAGMVVNIEVPYYEFGFGAVNVEDPVLVTADGARRLTTLSSALHVL